MQNYNVKFKNWIKENWFKLVLILLILWIGISLWNIKKELSAYYFNVRILSDKDLPLLMPSLKQF